MPRRELAILGFHNITPTFSQPFLEPRFPERFRQLVRKMSRRYELVTVSEGFRRLSSGETPPKPMLAFIFDDGYADMHEVIAPILEGEGAKGTSYVVHESLTTGKTPWYDELGRILFRSEKRSFSVPVDDTDYTVDLAGDPRQRVDTFWDVVRRMKRSFRADYADLLAQLAREHDLEPHDPAAEPLMMTVDQARDLLSRGHEVGCHSRTHPILPSLDDAALEDEILTAGHDLATLLDHPVTSFCYPNGDNDPRCQQLVQKAGYLCAVSMACGANFPDRWNPYHLHRAAMSENITPTWPTHTAFRVRSALVS